jgi:hypothetical protein
MEVIILLIVIFMAMMITVQVTDAGKGQAIFLQGLMIMLQVAQDTAEGMPPEYQEDPQQVVAGVMQELKMLQDQ